LIKRLRLYLGIWKIVMGTSGIGAVLPDPLKISLDSFGIRREERGAGVELGISADHASRQCPVRGFVRKFQDGPKIPDRGNVSRQLVHSPEIYSVKLLQIVALKMFHSVDCSVRREAWRLGYCLHSLRD